MSERSRAVEAIQRELTAFARRSRGQAQRAHPDLSLVAYTLLTHVARDEKTHAADLAEPARVVHRDRPGGGHRQPLPPGSAQAVTVTVAPNRAVSSSASAGRAPERLSSSRSAVTTPARSNSRRSESSSRPRP